MNEALGDGREAHRFTYLSDPLHQSIVLKLITKSGAFERPKLEICSTSPVQDEILAAFERNAQLLLQITRLSVPSYFLNGEQVVGVHANALPRLDETLRETLGEPGEEIS